MLTHNHEAEDGSHFLFLPCRSSAFPDPWVERDVPFKRGAAFLFDALGVHRGSGIPTASPTGVTNPRLMALFAMELTQGPNLRFPNLRVTQSIKRPQLWAPGGRVAKTVHCEGAVRCTGKVVAKCYGCDRAALCAAHKDGLCVPCHEGEEPERGEEEELVEDPNGVSIEHCAQCLLLVGTTTGHFLLSGLGVGREVVAPLTNEEVGGIAGHPDECPLAKVCHGEALPWPTLQGHLGIRVLPGCIFVVRKGLYGGTALQSALRPPFRPSPVVPLVRPKVLRLCRPSNKALKHETSGIRLRERLPSASRAKEKDFDLTSTKVFLTSPPSKGNLRIASKIMSPE